MRLQARAWWCWVAVGCLSSGLRAEPPAPAAWPSTRPSLDSVIEQLGDYRYSVRDDATRMLSELRPQELPILVKRYQEEQRHEPKLLLRLAIERVFYRRLMEGEAGFLGITPVTISSVYDPHTRQTVDCIFAETVHPNNPASRGGMLAKDLILEFDGQPVSRLMNPATAPKPRRDGQTARSVARNSPEIEAFTANVKRREPGTPLAVRVLRVAESLSVRVPGGPVDPQVFAPTLLPAPTPYSYALDAAISGLVVTQVPESSWLAEAGLRVQDVIVAVDGQPVPVNNATAEVLERSFRTASTQRRVKLDIRRLQQVELRLTIGVRPPELMNSPDWDLAQSQLASWWKEEVGEPSLRLRPATQYPYFAAVGIAPLVPEPQLVP